MRRWVVAITLCIFKIAQCVQVDFVVYGIEESISKNLSRSTDGIDFSREHSESEDHEKDLERGLKDVFSGLRSFITGTTFRYHLFESKIEIFKREIHEFGHAIEHSSSNSELGSQLLFVKKMFRAMVEATRKMKRYGKSVDNSKHLIYQIFELKVKVFKLQNINGNSNRQMSLFEEQLYTHFKSLYALEAAIS